MKKAPENIRFAAVAVDIVIFGIDDGVLKTLLIDIERHPHYVDMFGFPGGLIGSTETAEDAVERHLKEKTGLKDIFTEQLYTFSAVERDKRNRVVSIAYYGLVPSKVIATHTHQHTHWVPVADIKELAYDHNEILAMAHARLDGKLAYTNVAQFMLPKYFTLTELQSVYEIVIGKEFDKRNFRKKILALDIVEETGEKQEGVKNRPATLYKATTKKIVEIALFA
jgi:8-oxo-dGTP diphosphatase